MKKPQQEQEQTLRQQAEKALIEKKAIPTHKLSEADALKLIHELQVHQIELELQNEELQKALQAFRAEEADAYFAASLPTSHKQSAHLLAAILGSSLASWFFLMTSSEFGIWKRKLLISDVASMPIPDLKQAVKSQAGKQLLQIEKGLRTPAIEATEWALLDEAVFDLYDIDEVDRVVVRSGLFRASWQWQAGKLTSVAPADVKADITSYAEVFMSVISGWLSARNKRHMRAEVFELPMRDALRVVRFVLEDGPGNATVNVVKPQGELNDILDSIGKRLKVKIATALSGERELRVHGRNEVVIIKPAARRYWMGVSALEDADAVVAESFIRGNA